MLKRVTKAAVMFYIAIIHPVISCLIWVSLNGVKQIAPDQNVIKYGLTFLQLFVMVIASALVYWPIKRKKYLYPFQLKTMLAVSYVIFMINLTLVFVKNNFPLDRTLLMEIIAVTTLGVTECFFYILLLVMIIECIIREISLRGLKSKEEININNKVPKIAVMLYISIIHPIITYLLWVISGWVVYRVPNYFDANLGIFLFTVSVVMQSLIMVITSILVYYWFSGKRYLDFFQLKKFLAFSGIIFMLMIKFGEEHLPLRIVFILGYSPSLVLITTGLLLIILLILMLVDYITRNTPSIS